MQPKYLINSANFPYGFVTPDDSWSNRWRTGPNAALGWTRRCPAAATAPSRSGRSSSPSAAFAQCQVTKVFTGGVLPRTASATDQTTVSAITASFQSGGYKLKHVFQQSAAACPGQ